MVESRALAFPRGSRARTLGLLLPGHSMVSLLATVLVVQAQLVAATPRTPLPKPSPNAAVASAQWNEKPSGSLRARELTLAIDVVNARWKPDGENDPELPILAFAEAGKAPTVPGPLVRV